MPPTGPLAGAHSMVDISNLRNVEMLLFLIFFLASQFCLRVLRQTFAFAAVCPREISRKLYLSQWRATNFKFLTLTVLKIGKLYVFGRLGEE